MQPTQRLISLDVFRGITIAGMILVNNPGSWSHVYPPLLHADWHGCTPTDWVFPFFLFIVGVAIAFSIGKRKESHVNKRDLLQKVIIRSLIIFGIGLFMAAFPHFGIQNRASFSATMHYLVMASLMILVFTKETFPKNAKEKKIIWWGILGLGLMMLILSFGLYDFSHLRIPGVLQRIALVYLFSSILFLFLDWKSLLYVGVGLLVSYWGIMSLIPVPDGYPANLEAETNLGAWMDRTLLGTEHLWSVSKTWDPEGLLSTLPAISTGISGVLTGLWLRSNHNDYKKVAGILASGSILIALACIWDLVFPINKKIWTSSYVLYTSGVALSFLGVIYWVVDIHQQKWWTKPFVVYGMNALFVFVMSGLVAKLLYVIQWTTASGATQTPKGWIYSNFFTPYLDPYNASLAFAVTNVLFFLGLSWILYNRKIFIKV